MARETLAPDDKMNLFFKECSALSTMVGPTGSVSAQDYARLLKVAKQYRKWCHECLDGPMIDGYIVVPRLRTQVDLKIRYVKDLLKSNKIEAAEQVLGDLTTNHSGVQRLRAIINDMKDDGC